MSPEMDQARLAEAEASQKLTELRLHDQKQSMRPSNHFDVKILWSQTNCTYVAFRENVAVEGDTPEGAMENFDHLWVTGEGLINLPDDLDDSDDFD